MRKPQRRADRHQAGALQQLESLHEGGQGTLDRLLEAAPEDPAANPLRGPDDPARPDHEDDLERRETHEDPEREDCGRVGPGRQLHHPSKRVQDPHQREPIEHALDEQASEGGRRGDRLAPSERVGAHELADPRRQHIVGHEAHRGGTGAAAYGQPGHGTEQDPPPDRAHPDVDDRRQDEHEREKRPVRGLERRPDQRPLHAAHRPPDRERGDENPDPRLPPTHQTTNPK